MYCTEYSMFWVLHKKKYRKSECSDVSGISTTGQCELWWICAVAQKVAPTPSSRWKKLQHNSYLRIWKHKIQEQIYSVKIYFLHFIDENQRNRTLTDRSCNHLPTFSVTFSDNSAAFWPASAVNFQPTWEWTEMKTLFYERSTFNENYATMLIGWQKSSSLFIGK